MSKKLLQTYLSEIKSLRVACPREECEQILEFPLAMGFPTGCPTCNQRYIGDFKLRGDALCEGIIRFQSLGFDASFFTEDTR